MHLTGKLSKRPLRIDAEQCAEPRDPEQQSEVGHGQRTYDYRHCLMFLGLHESPDDHRQNQKIAGHANDEDHPVDGRTDAVGRRRPAYPGGS